MSNYNTQLQSIGEDLQGILQTLQSKVAGSGNSFPYKITVTTSGIDNAPTPVISYGDDGDTVLISTYANSGGAYSATWSYTRCQKIKEDVDISPPNSIGNFAVFNGFSGDATIHIDWSLQTGYE